ncbi:DUF3592 domain-containing protein [Methylococcus mesophilus]|uniref:hypothetical protein n=1 Tax=Methylococcus mesophilus TaxID=2993564 RepID=UPI00224A6D34|nr:hypothetical protein [Methylococcus mesophilus]UZR27149.1 hypothetical protein OOT43_10400 [Methylococcus mesophilus]
MRIPALLRRGLLLSLFASAAGCTTIVDRFSGRNESCEILRTGRPATARIVGLADTGITINQNPVAEFVLEVQPDQGPPFEAKTKALISHLEVPLAQPGRTVPVKYDPQRHDRVALDLWECD